MGMERREVIARAVGIRFRIGPRITAVMASLRAKAMVARVMIRIRIEAKKREARVPSRAHRQSNLCLRESRYCG